MANPSRTDLLRALPQVEEMLQLPEVSALLSLLPRSVLADCALKTIAFRKLCSYRKDSHLLAST